jgi:hypothetical protein
MLASFLPDSPRSQRCGILSGEGRILQDPLCMSKVLMARLKRLTQNRSTARPTIPVLQRPPSKVFVIFVVYVCLVYPGSERNEFVLVNSMIEGK